MTENDFKERAAKADNARDIDHLCFSWLRSGANEQAPKVREMMLCALDILRAGLQ